MLSGEKGNRIHTFECLAGFIKEPCGWRNLEIPLMGRCTGHLSNCGEIEKIG